MTKVIGITGRAGSGKSYASDRLKKHYELESIDLDQIGHLMLSEPSCKKEIVAAFGAAILDETGDIDRGLLGERVFSSDTDLDRGTENRDLDTLNAIVHPRMKAYVELKILEKNERPILIVGALIQEIGLSELCDHIITIDASDDDIKSHAGAKQHHIATTVQRARASYQEEGDLTVVNDFTEGFEEELLQAMTTVF